MMTKRIIIYLTIIFSCLFSHPLFAKNNQPKENIRFPIGCKPMGYKFDLYNVIFRPSNKMYSQTVYFILNKSNMIIHLLQVSNGNELYLVHIDGNIYPNKWSVLAASETEIKYICTQYNEYKDDHRVLNCQKVLDICEFPRARFGTNHRGTYWLTLNQSLISALKVARFHGVLLTDPKQTKEYLEQKQQQIWHD